jgi:hypothetical protein
VTLPWTPRYPSAARFRDRLAASGDPLRLYMADAQYQLQVNYTCTLLDVVDEAADEATAAMITDLICDRLTGEGAAAAAERIRAARADLERAERTAVPHPAAWTARWVPQ